MKQNFSLIVIKIFILFTIKTPSCTTDPVYQDYYDYCTCEDILDDTLIEEIASYKNITESIMGMIQSTVGDMLYERKCANTMSVIERYDDDCNLSSDSDLIHEIKSYKNITLRIIKEITTTDMGTSMYERYTEFIDKFGARVSGSDVLESAIDHMINLTHEYQVTDVTTEEVEVPHWVRGRETVTMLKPRRKKVAVLGLAPNIPTPLGGITAELIVVKSFAELDQIEFNVVRGKIVLFNVPFTTYGETVIYRSLGAIKAAKKGAIASLIRSITPFSLYTPHTGSQQYDDKVTKIPAGAITLEDADLLTRLQEQGETILLKIEMFSSIEQKISRNTIIDLKGTKTPENVVIVSGHIDSWDVGQGAMDDGGGMMISWFVPIVLQRLALTPKRTVRSILWTAEEPGLIGAAAYLKRHRSELDNINLIMESDEGTFKPLGLDVAGSKNARCIIAEILKLFKPIDKIKESAYVGSDINLFIEKGVPGVSLLNENDRYYWFHHSEADSLNVQNQEDVIQCAAFWAAFTYVVADLSVDIPRN